jgi:hypothetical protein
MQRYFFDLKQDPEADRDIIGVYLEDAAAADREALRGLADLIRERFQQLNLDDLVMEVRDERGVVIIRASVAIRHELLPS